MSPAGTDHRNHDDDDDDDDDNNDHRRSSHYIRESLSNLSLSFTVLSARNIPRDRPDLWGIFPGDFLQLFCALKEQIEASNQIQLKRQHYYG